MTAITVRLSTEDHKLLQLACLVTGRNQNALITELLHSEFERVLRRNRDVAPNPDGLWESLGVQTPRPSELDRHWAALVIDSLEDNDTDYGDASCRHVA